MWKTPKSLYLHVPFCRHLCNYCDFYKHKLDAEQGQSMFQNYHTLLENQLQIFRNLDFASGILRDSTELETIYFGGGTPSLWGSDGVLFFKSFLKKCNFSLANLQEWTLECDPLAYEPEALKAWSEIGVSRLSIGLQSSDDHFLKVADRLHSYADIIKLAELAHELNLDLSFDFLLGLPAMGKKRNIEEELEKILRLRPTHLSLYILEVGKGYRHFSQLPEAEEVSAEYLTVSNYLTEAGYEHYEVSSFARRGFQAGHNSRYWNESSIFAFGPSATGVLYDELMLGATRWKWGAHAKVPEIETLGASELLLERFYVRTRLLEGIPWKNYFGERPPRLLQEIFINLVSEKFIYPCLESGNLILTTKGRLFHDSIVEKCSPYLDICAPETNL